MYQDSGRAMHRHTIRTEKEKVHQAIDGCRIEGTGSMLIEYKKGSQARYRGFQASHGESVKHDATPSLQQAGVMIAKMVKQIMNLCEKNLVLSVSY